MDKIRMLTQKIKNGRLKYDLNSVTGFFTGMIRFGQGI